MTNNDNTIARLMDLAAIAEEYARVNWIFRGVNDEQHTLTPAIGRDDFPNHMAGWSSTIYTQMNERDMLERFKREAARISRSPLQRISSGSRSHSTTG